MRVDAEFIGTDNVEVTLTITMPLRDWKALRESTTDKYPGYQFRSAIAEAVSALERRVSVKAPE